MLVREVLKTKPNRIHTIAPEARVDDALALMVTHNIGSLPVLDAQDVLIGVVSERDIIRGLHRQGEAYRSRSIAEVMTADPVTCESEDDVQDVMRKMSEHHIAKVPVLMSGRLVGVVSVGDVVKILYQQVKDENVHLISYLYGQA